MHKDSLIYKSLGIPPISNRTGTALAPRRRRYSYNDQVATLLVGGQLHEGPL